MEHGMDKLKSILKDILTETNCEVYDNIRIMAVLSVVVALGLQIWTCVRADDPQEFDMLKFGTGIAAVFGGVGVALKLKPESPKE
jgi:hypothetical protein